MGNRRIIRVGCALALAVALAGCQSITRVSSSTYQDGVRCLEPQLSGSGTYVAFHTLDDPSGTRYAKPYVRNVDSGATATPPGLVGAHGLSDDGGTAVVIKVVRVGDDVEGRVLLWKRATGQATQVSPSGTSAYQAAISGDGQRVAYVAGGAVWLSRAPGTTPIRISPTPSAGSDVRFEDPDLSRTGSVVSFRQTANTAGEDDVLVHDVASGTTHSLFTQSGSPYGSDGGSVSDDGRFVAFAEGRAGILGGTLQVYLWDRTTGTSTRITGAGKPYSSAGPVLSGDGKRLAFVRLDQRSDNAAAVVVLDRATKEQITRIGGNHHVVSPSLSTDGHRMAFCTDATDVVKGSPEAPNVYVWSEG